jgi:serine/threonine protein kinase
MPKFKYQEKEIQREKEAHAKNIKNDNVVKLRSFHEGDDFDEYSYFAYEPCEISLKHLLEPDEHSSDLAKKLKSVNLKKILNEAMSGLRELHKTKFYHRNIRPGNIMIAKRNAEYVGKISNMLLSKRLRPGCLTQSVTENLFFGNVWIFIEVVV